MMKKASFIVAVFAFVATILPTKGFSQTDLESTVYDFAVEGKYYLVTNEADAEGKNGEVQLQYVAPNLDTEVCVLADSVKYGDAVYVVTKIGKGAFVHNMYSTIRVPESVVEIADLAFYEAYDMLEELILGSNVAKIGVDAFETCANLKDVVSLNLEAPEISFLQGNTHAFGNTVLHIARSSWDSYAPVWGQHFNNVVLHELTFAVDDMILDTTDGDAQVEYISGINASSNGPVVSSAYLEWTSTDANVATVNATGVVTPVAEGDCVITATSIFGDSQSLTLTVTDDSGIVTSIDNVTTDLDKTNFRAYTLDGTEVTSRPLSRGIYVIVYSDGTVKKELR